MNMKYINSAVSEEDIKNLVHHFYDLVRADETLGPIFAEKITDWPKHLGIMCDFWSSIILKTNRFNGRPMLKHQMLAKSVTRADFIIWLKLFYQAVDEVCPEAGKQDFVMAAERIAESLQIGMFDRPFDMEEVKKYLEFLEAQERMSA
ncbi:group III truncated hemoglobin [Terasakiella sp. A23]|uniref:group III truncated hemoglobin n=1 Tax=Terasakiella sp. FCG-A23 TaxID=3080561 RepID=UPI002953F2F8|nr:group III truncated hemoglobin [Terasakiella sp. A23]MDV7339610.1 group III truncated hemoglobin [Terasakiella sp. A23]